MNKEILSEPFPITGKVIGCYYEEILGVDIMTTVTKPKNKYEYAGKWYTLDELIKVAKLKFDNKLSTTLLYSRISPKANGRQWSIDEALRTPVRGRKTVPPKTEQQVYTVNLNQQKKFFVIDGKKLELKTLQNLARFKYNNESLTEEIINYAVKHGWSLDKILRTQHLELHTNKTNEALETTSQHVEKEIDVAKELQKKISELSVLVGKIKQPKVEHDLERILIDNSYLMFGKTRLNADDLANIRNLVNIYLAGRK